MLFRSNLENAINEQEFEKAAELRDRIKLLEKKSETISELKSKMKSFVENQEYEKAAEIRDKIRDLEK